MPEPHISFEETSVASIGLPRLSVEGAYCCEVTAGDSPETRTDSLVLERVDGATWLDYYKRYDETLKRWLELVSFEQSKYRLAVVDACDPLSVLFLGALEGGSGTTVLVKVADAASNPLKQNTSFVALEALKRKGLPYIMVAESFVDGLTVWTGESLHSGTDALMVIAGYLAGNMKHLQGFLSRDLKLGLTAHYIVPLVSASEVVYKSPADALKVVAGRLRRLVAGEEIRTMYMIAIAPSDEAGKVQDAFESFSKGLNEVISSDSAVVARTGPSGLFDLLLLVGVREPRAQMSIERGYRIIVDAAADLEVDEIEKTA